MTVVEVARKKLVEASTFIFLPRHFLPTLSLHRLNHPIRAWQVMLSHVASVVLLHDTLFFTSDAQYRAKRIIKFESYIKDLISNHALVPPQIPT
jgi:hypothetical protein